MTWVLLALCLLFSALTWSEQQPGGAAAAQGVADDILAAHAPPTRVLVAVRGQPDDVAYADTLAEILRKRGATVVAVVKGEPKEARAALAAANAAAQPLDVIAGSGELVLFAERVWVVGDVARLRQQPRGVLLQVRGDVDRCVGPGPLAEARIEVARVERRHRGARLRGYELRRSKAEMGQNVEQK
jgi:hypothetical protein